MNIKDGHLYAVNTGGHPEIDTPEPYLCVNLHGQPRFVHAPGLAESHDGPYDTTEWADIARRHGWTLRPDHILGPWNQHKPRTGEHLGTLTTTHQTPAHTTTITTAWHEQDGYTCWIHTTTNNPHHARTLMRYLGATRHDAELHTGISTPETGRGA